MEAENTDKVARTTDGIFNAWMMPMLSPPLLSEVSLFTLGRICVEMTACTNRIPPKTPNGIVKPPSWKRAPPAAGPMIIPTPKDISTNPNTGETELGKIWATNVKLADKNAEIPIAPTILFMKERAMKL